LAKQKYKEIKSEIKLIMAQKYKTQHNYLFVYLIHGKEKWV